MLEVLYFHDSNVLNLLIWSCLLTLLTLLVNIVYNLYFHPLAHIPGPLLARASGVPSWYYAYHGKHHIWLWQQFQIYGNRIRVSPNTVLFCDPKAYVDIYGLKSNVRRSDFYTAWQRNEHDAHTLNTVDVATHAYKRKLLNLSFTEKSVRAASVFITQHVDRWNQILVKDSGEDWSALVNFSDAVDTLVFDIMGDLCFGKSFDIKEPGENSLKSIPHNISEYMQFYYSITRSPFLNSVLWLKSRGLNQLLEAVTPSAVKAYYKFVHDSVTERLALQKEQASKPENERRQDMFYFLCEARDPDTGHPAYDEETLRGEANLLIIAGSDTTAISLSSILFYLTDNQGCCQKLVDEIRSKFESTDDIVYGPKLQSCIYLKACIDEGMRLTPPCPSELPREVLPGGLEIGGEWYPSGTVVGTSLWVDSRNQEVYRDPEIFRPERWIVDEATGNTEADVARIRRNLHPFSSGPGSCLGKNLAMTELMIAIARTLHRLDVRRAPGSTLGGGAPELGWGARDKRQFQVNDAYISIRRGPELQFRKRKVSHV